MPANNRAVTTVDSNKRIEVDEKLANGPLAKRGCTDILCCLLFIGFVGAMIGVAGYALSKGDPNIVGRGYDYDGNICGYSEGYEDYPYLYFPYPYPTAKYRTKTVCLKECPDASMTDLTEVCKTNSQFEDCKRNNNGANTESDQIKALTFGTTDTTGSDKAFYIYNTTGFIDRFCLPRSKAFKEAIAGLFNSDFVEQWISDIKQTWQVILASMGVAFVIGFFYMFVMRYCSGVLTWLAIFVFIAGTAALGYTFYQQAKDLEEQTAESRTETEERNILTEKIIAYVCFGISGFTVLAILCLWSRIKLAIAILKAAADYVKDTPSAFAVPIVIAVSLIALYAYWAATAFYLVSCGEPHQIEGYPFGSFDFNQTLKRLLLLHLFGLLWFNAFIIAAMQFIMASSTCLWYFSQGTGQGASGTIRKSVWRVFRYHIGSIAFGSLILAIVQFIRIILAYMQAQANKLKTKEGKIVQFVLGCLQCYAECFERFIKKLNKWAYIQVALSGKNFCRAAWDGLQLVMKNPIRFSVVGGIGTIFTLFGKLFVAAITALIGFLVITKWDRFSENVSSPFIPTLLIFIFAYVIGACFMTVYGMAGDAIFACFILDEEIHSRKNSPPLHCPESLKEFLNKYKKN